MIYNHGEVVRYEVRELSQLKLRIGNFTNGDNDETTSYITEEDKVSLLIREFDKEHKEVFTIVRGKVKEISTNMVRYGMSKEDQMKCIFICMDCSKDEKSDIRPIKLCNVVEVHDINYTYEEIKTKEIEVVESDPEWNIEPGSDKSIATVDLKTNVKLQ